MVNIRTKFIDSGLDTSNQNIETYLIITQNKLFTAFQAEQVVSYQGKTLLPLKTPLLHGERVAVTKLARDTPKEEVRNVKKQILNVQIVISS